MQRHGKHPALSSAHSAPAAPEHHAARYGDRWLGSRELPGYRAGRILVRLADLPQVDADHLYCDLILLDVHGETLDTHSGPCLAMARRHPLRYRARFVRVVAELLRPVVDGVDGLAPLRHALTFLRERGVEFGELAFAARLLDAACSEQVVADSLHHLLALLLGEERARHVVSGVVDGLARESAFGPWEDGDSGSRRINKGGLNAQVSYIVQTVGKLRARSYLHEATDVALVPQAEMFGL